ncbi:hypothetical protein GE061_009119 [Apolygus lucorum]|uniref:Uncharacterized protein n=1 Tax=Apolygus lucorum TaxID=248454 RepID=A0A8S9Y0R8_APOLU|nr:hypothetical protein GE061_009119 [Apolygus lucorum]
MHLLEVFTLKVMYEVRPESNNRHVVVESWDHSVEVKSPIEKARATFIRMKPFLCHRDLGLDMKMRIVRCYVYPVLLYGAESWTLSEDAERRIQAFEMWVYRRLLRISWVDRVTNAQVLHGMGCSQPELLYIVKKRKLEYLGHVLRNEEKYRLLQNVLQGKVKGGPGRLRISWLANLRKWFGVSSVKLFRRAVHKSGLAEMIANIQTG